MNGFSPAHRAILALLFSAVLCSAAGVCVKSIHWNSFAITGLMGGIGALVHWAWFGFKSLHFSKTQWLAGACFAAGMFLYIVAMQFTTAANAIFLNYTSSTYIAFLGWWLLNERISRIDVLSITLMILGVLLFFCDRLTFEGWVGNFYALVSAIPYALSIVLMRKEKKESPLKSLLLGNAMSFVVGLPFMFSAAPQGAGWFGLIALGIFYTGVPTILLAYGIPRVRAIDTTFITMINPILAPLWVFLFIGEIPQPLALVGGTIVLLASLLQGWRATSQKTD